MIFRPVCAIIVDMLETKQTRVDTPLSLIQGFVFSDESALYTIAVDCIALYITTICSPPE